MASSNMILVAALLVGYFTSIIIGACDENCCSAKDINGEGSTPNLAKDPDVTGGLSSQYPCGWGFCFPASKAFDGIYVPEITSSSVDHESIAVTQKTQSPYIQIDLGRSRCVKGVKIWNRVNDVITMERFQNALISVADSPSASGFGTNSGSTKCAYLAGTQSGVRFHQCSAPMFGRYIRVSGINMNSWLNLYEIEVHGWY